MQYTVLGFSQTKLIEYNLSIIDAHILRWFVDFYQTGKMVKVSDDENPSRVYSWVKYDAVMNDLPLLGITNVRVIARRFEALCECGLMNKLIKKTAKGTYTCFSLDPEKYNDLLSSTAKPAVLKSTVGHEDKDDDESSEPASKVPPSEVEKTEPTGLKSTVDQAKPTVQRATVPKSTVALPEIEKRPPTALESTVPTVPKSTVLLSNSSPNLTPLSKNPASASSVLRKIEELDSALIFDNEFYPAAAGFLNTHNLEEDYIEWLYNTLRKSPDIKNLRGYFYRVFCREVYAQRFLAERTKYKAQVETPQGVNYVCPVCGNERHLSYSGGKCEVCGTAIHPNAEEITRGKALYKMDARIREEYNFERLGIIKHGGNIAAALREIDEKYGIPG